MRNIRSRCVILASLASTMLLVFVFVGIAKSEPNPETSGSTQDHGVSGDRPNIVLIVTDDLDKTTMNRLPDVREVVGGGMDFDRAYVSDPFCCPSRASILTGKYVVHHGVKSNVGTSGGASAFQKKGLESQTIATALDGAGYRTALVGKYLNGNGEQIPAGWDRWYGWIGDPHAGSHRISTNEGIRTCEPKRCHDTDYLSGRAQEFIGSNTEDPFFLYLAFNAPHDPDIKYVAPRYRSSLKNFGAARTPSYRETDLRDKPRWVRSSSQAKTERMKDSLDLVARNRARTMLSVRDAYANLVKTLKENGELDSTYIIFTSDHGIYVGDHGLGVGKRSPYLHDTEVPLYVRGPGIESTTNSSLVSNIDLYPTILDMASVSYDSSVIDGRSLLPLAEGEDVPWRNRVFIEGYSVAAKGSPYPVPSFTSIVEQRRTYTSYGTGEEEFYNLTKDPYQLDNLAGNGAGSSSLAPLESSVRDFRGCDLGECREIEDR